MPRPIGTAVHGQRPLQAVHLDFLYIEPVHNEDHNYVYILVIKDDFSGIIRLIPCEAATSAVAAEALLQWIADFNTPEVIITDGGSHFTAAIINELTHRRKMQHHITVSYTPTGNGTVERVNRTIISVLKALTSENQMSTHHWPYLSPVVQSIINNTPSVRLANNAPFTVLTGQPAESPLDQVWNATTQKWTQITTTQMGKYMSELLEDLEELHKEVSTATDKRRQQARKPTKKPHKPKVERFIPGDWVLTAVPVKGPGSKLKANWRGPHKVTQAINEYVYEVEDIITNKKWKTHVVRMRQYHDPSLTITTEMRNHLALTGNTMAVEALNDVRRSPSSNDLEIQVQWLGFEANEATWENAQHITEDVPKMVQQLLRKIGNQHPVHSELEALLFSQQTVSEISKQQTTRGKKRKTTRKKTTNRNKRQRQR